MKYFLIYCTLLLCSGLYSNDRNYTLFSKLTKSEVIDLLDKYTVQSDLFYKRFGVTLKPPTWIFEQYSDQLKGTKYEKILIEHEKNKYKKYVETMEKFSREENINQQVDRIIDLMNKFLERIKPLKTFINKPQIANLIIKMEYFLKRITNTVEIIDQTEINIWFSTLQDLETNQELLEEEKLIKESTNISQLNS